MEKKLSTSTPSASYDSSFGRNDLLAAPSCRRTIETKPGQNRMFYPGGSGGRLRACPFLGTWRALLCGEVLVLERLVAACSVFGGKDDKGVINLLERDRQIVYAVCITVYRCFSTAANLKRSCRRG